MLTTLWDKFVSAIRWSRGSEAAAVAVIQAAPAAQAEVLLLNAADSASAPPPSASAGANIEGLRTVNLYAFAAGTYAASVKIWLYTGHRWVPLTTVDLDESVGALDALDTEGYTRIYLEVTEHADAAFSVGIFPYNEGT
jgi:hypothetical protein